MFESSPEAMEITKLGRITQTETKRCSDVFDDCRKYIDLVGENFGNGHTLPNILGGRMDIDKKVSIIILDL